MKTTRNTMKNLFVFFLFTIGYSIVHSENYYQGTENLRGKKLKQKLYKIICHHKKIRYKQLWKYLSYTDQDPNNHRNIILFYTGWSRPKNQNGGSISQWNREHIWPKARGGFKSKKGPGTDLHHIRPTDVSVNAKRGHLGFDEGGRIYIDNDGVTECRFDLDSWEPPHNVKGDVARMLFYMATRYEGEYGEPDLELVEDLSRDFYKPSIGKLSILLRWHKEDKVSLQERMRNQKVYKIQGNRNPFIDHPEFVEKIWKAPGSEIRTPSKKWQIHKKNISSYISIKKAFTIAKGREVWIVGYIIGEFNNQYGIKIADRVNNVNKFLVVKLPKNKRTIFNPLLSPKALNRRILIKGIRQNYAHFPGIKQVFYIAFTKSN